MKERLHEQITNELRQVSRNDTTVITVALIVTFIFFGLAFGFSANAIDHNYSLNIRSSQVSVNASIIMFVSLAVIVTVNWLSIAALEKNKAQKVKLTESLGKLYQEENLNQYYDNLSGSAFETRRAIYTAILVIISAAAIIIPMTWYVTNIVQQM